MGLATGLGHIQEVHALVDVRTLGEWNKGHIPGAYFVENLQSTKNISALKGCEKCRVVTYCHMGPRAKMAAKLLEEAGFESVGEAYGITQWKEAGYELVNTPTTKPSCVGTGICYPVKLPEVKLPDFVNGPSSSLAALPARSTTPTLGLVAVVAVAALLLAGFARRQAAPDRQLAYLTVS